MAPSPTKSMSGSTLSTEHETSEPAFTPGFAHENVNLGRLINIEGIRASIDNVRRDREKVGQQDKANRMPAEVLPDSKKA